MLSKSTHPFRLPIAAALVLALAVAATPAAAAGYIKFDGVDGEVAKSSDKPRLAVLEVQAWSWGAKDGAKGGNVEFEWKVEEGESAPPRPGGAQDIAAAPSPAATASGTPTGKRQHKPLTITKEVDKATPKLMEAAAKGKLFVMVPAGTCVAGARYPSAEFGTGTRVYKLENVVVASCSPAVSGGSDARPMESLSLNFERIKG